MAYQIYNDGMEWGEVQTEKEAQAIVSSYDGDHEVWYEKIEED